MWDTPSSRGESDWTFSREPLDEIIWTFCNLDEIKTKQQFFGKCPLYNDLRNSLLDTTLAL